MEPGDVIMMALSQSSWVLIHSTYQSVIGDNVQLRFILRI